MSRGTVSETTVQNTKDQFVVVINIVGTLMFKIFLISRNLKKFTDLV